MRDNSGLTPLSVTDVIGGLLENVGKEDVRFRLGWSVDDRCGEVAPGEMALLWARTAGGKTTWLLNVIRNTPDIPTVVFNMEMSPGRQLEWLTTMTFDLPVPARDLDRALRSPQHPQHSTVRAAFNVLPDFYPHLHLLNPNRPSIEELQVVVEDIADMTGVKPMRVFIDHLTLMRGVSDYGSVMGTTADLHSWALDAGLAIFVVQQTGRGNAAGGLGRDDGHMPVTLASGLYAGEHDADWVYGLYRPDRNPEFKKRQHEFKKMDDYLKMVHKRQQLAGISVFQVLKNRPFGEDLPEGIQLQYDPYNRTLNELEDLDQ